MKLITSSPGKVILFGEHAVVYGKTAIACAISLRCYCYLEKTATKTVSFESPGFIPKLEFNLHTLAGIRSQFSNRNDAELILALKEFLIQQAGEAFSGSNPVVSESKSYAVLAFLFAYIHTTCTAADSGLEHQGIIVKIHSEIPIGAGLGSSAAFCVSIAHALLGLCDPAHNLLTFSDNNLTTVDQEAITTKQKRINELAFLCEKIIHGNPSGVDNTVSAYGHSISYKRNLGAAPGENPSTTAQLQFPSLNISIVDTKVPRSTKKLVAKVADRRSVYPNIINPILDAIDAISKAYIQHISDAPTNANIDFNTLSSLIDTNQNLLNCLGVGHPSLDQIVHGAKLVGLPAKLTGSGGGGCAIFLHHSELGHGCVDSLSSRLTSHGFDVYTARLGDIGTQSHALSKIPTHIHRIFEL